MPEPPRVVAIFGPTGSGKTDVAEAVADRIGGDVVSCDAMQAYRGLPILTNQPARPTRLVGVWPLAHEGSVGDYRALAHAAIDELVCAGQTAVVAGGTGLYLRAALGELQLPPAPSPDLRARIDALYGELGPEAAHARLEQADPAAAAAVHANDRRRVVRALELAELGGSLVPERDRLWSDEYRHPTLVVGLDLPAEALNARIERRARSMWERGAEEEARRALAEPISTQARQVIGLREVAAGLDAAAAVESVVRRTRAYARRQRLWLRRIPGVASVAADRPTADIADAILDMAGAGERLPAHGGG